MPATHQRDFLHKLMVLLVFIEFNILICILIGRQRRTHLNPESPPALQPAPQPQPQPAPRRRRKLPYPCVMPWILLRQEKRCYSNLLTDLIYPSIPEFCQDSPLPFFTSSRNAYTTASRSQSAILGSP